MAQCVQNVTLSLTLPISCQICLGKVREPVICSNNHVFCSLCIDIWLNKASQCPTCRTPITAESPCRKIIGATNESESKESRSIRRHLRQTRADLLLREYEDEIEGVQKENDELRSQNSSVESQLKALSASRRTTGSDQSGEEAGVEPREEEEEEEKDEEWSRKLREATDASERVRLDAEKLKEANKTLRSQNIDLVRENLRLKAEVENRSPQKFGRYTVAALEAKISQHERDLLHLRRALERSDEYVEELEARLADPEASGRKTEEEEEDGEDGGGAEGRSLIAVTKVSVPPAPSTPSSSFSCLSLGSPWHGVTKRSSRLGPLSYLRRLSFEECGAIGASDSPVPGSTPGGSGGVGGGRERRAKGVSSEDSMNAAYLDKVSELGCMIAETENRAGPSAGVAGSKVNGTRGEDVTLGSLFGPPEREGPTGSKVNATREDVTLGSLFGPPERAGPMGSKVNATLEDVTLGSLFALPEREGPTGSKVNATRDDVTLDSEVAQNPEANPDSSPLTKRKAQSSFEFASPSKVSKFE